MKAEKQQSKYVVYPSALFDGWEVVKEPDEAPIFFETRDAATLYAHARAVADGGAVVKFENWFGNTEGIWSVPSQASPCQESLRVAAGRGLSW